MKAKKIISTIVASALILSNCCILSPVSYADEYKFESSNAGHSGSASGTGLFLGAVGTTEGTPDRAPFITGVTGNNSTEVASARVGALEFQIDGNIDPETIVTADLSVYVNGVNENLKSDWMLLAAYETDNTSLAYSVGGMDQSEYPAVNEDYSYEAAFWSNEQCSKSNLGWKTINVKRAVVNALEKDNGASETVNVVLRMQVPSAGLNISTTYKPYIEISTGEKVDGVIKYVDQNGNEILPQESFATGR